MNNRQIDFIRKDCADVILQPESLSPLKNQTVNITGAGGFVGSWLLELFNYLNCEFDFNTKVIAGTRSWTFSKEYRPHIFSYKNMNFIESDVRTLSDIPEECQYIIHLAATPDNRTHASDPLDVVNSIVQGTDNVLMAASRLTNLKKILYFSSGYVYGRQPLELDGVSEDQFWPHNCASISSAYSESKRMAETICNIYRSQMRLPISTVRPFAFIGPYQLLNRPWAINNFIRDAFNGQKIRLVGDDQTVRSYMYPSDMAYWTLKFLVDSKDGTTLNLGSSSGHSLNEVAKMVASNFSKNLSIDTPALTTNLLRTRFVPNIDRAKEQFKLNVSINLENAIKKTINWFNLGK